MADAVATQPRTLQQLASDPAFQTAPYNIRKEMFDTWLTTDGKTILAPYPAEQQQKFTSEVTNFFNQAYPAPKGGGFADVTGALGRGALETTAAIGEAVSPTNVISATLRSGADYLRDQYQSAQARDLEREAQQRMAAAGESTLGQIGATLSDIYRRPVQKLAGAAGAVVPVVGAAAGIAATGGTAAVPLSTAVGIGAGAAANIGEVRHARAEAARAMPVEQLRMDPSAASQLDAGVPEAQVREEVAQRTGAPEVIAGITGAVPGGWAGRLGAARQGLGLLSGRLGTAAEGAVVGATGAVGTRAAQNIAEQQFDPTRSVTSGLVPAALEAGIAGGILGTALHSRTAAGQTRQAAQDRVIAERTGPTLERLRNDAYTEWSNAAQDNPQLTTTPDAIFRSKVEEYAPVGSRERQFITEERLLENSLALDDTLARREGPATAVDNALIEQRAQRQTLVDNVVERAINNAADRMADDAALSYDAAFRAAVDEIAPLGSRTRAVLTPEVQATAADTLNNRLQLATRLVEGINAFAREEAPGGPADIGQRAGAPAADIGSDTVAGRAAGTGAVPYGVGGDGAPGVGLAGAGGAAALPTGGDNVRLGDITAPAAEPVRRLGPGEADVGGPVPAATVAADARVSGRARARGPAQPAAIAPSGVGAAPSPVGGPQPVTGRGGRARAGTTGERPATRPRPARVAENVKAARDEATLAKPEVMRAPDKQTQIRRWAKEPLERQQLVVDEGRERGYSNPLEFLQSAAVDKTTPQKTLWNSISKTVQGVANRVMRGIAVLATSVGLYHATPIRDAHAAVGGAPYGIVRTVPGLASERANVLNSWIREAADSGGRKYIIADMPAGTVHTMSRDGAVTRTTPALFSEDVGPGTFMLTGDAGTIGVHRVETPTGRSARTAEGTGAERRINLGPVNVPAELFNSVIGSDFGGRLYIIPDEASTLSTSVDSLVAGIEAAAAPEAPATPLTPEPATPAQAPAQVPGAQTAAMRRGSRRAATPETPPPVEPAPPAPNPAAVLRAGAEATLAMTQAQRAAVAETPRQQQTRTASIINKLWPGPKRRNPQGFDETMATIVSGELPIDEAARASTWSRFRELFMDNMEPFVRRVGNAPELMNPFGRNRNLSHEFANEVARRSDNVMRDIIALSKRTKVRDDVLHREVGANMLADWVPVGNQELRARAQETIRQAEVDIRELTARQDEPGVQAAIDNAEKQRAEARELLDQHARYDNVIRKVGAKGSEVPFTGGLTTAEAAAIKERLSKKSYAADLDRIGANIRDIQQDQVRKAMAELVLSDEDAATFSKSPFYVPTTGRPAPEGAPLTQGRRYSLGEYERKGRRTTSDNPMQSVIESALSLAKKRAYREFDDALLAANGQHGITVYPGGANIQGAYDIRRAEMGDDGRSVTKRYKVVMDDPQAQAALTNANVSQVTNAFLNNVVRPYTSLFSWLVTRAVLSFAPVNAVRDAGERATNVIANSGLKISGPKLAVDTHRNLPPAIKGMTDMLRGREGGQWAQDARRLRELGGLLTRNTALRTDMQTQFNRLKDLRGARGLKTKLFDSVHAYNEAFEGGASVALFRSLLNQGVDEKTAAAATIRSMDLNQRGTHTSYLNMLYPFFSTRMVGADNVFKSFQTKRGLKTFAAQVVAGLALYEMAKAIGGTEDELLGNRTDLLTGTQVQRSIPIWTGDSYIKIPVPYGQGFAAWNTAVALSRLASGAMSASDAAEHIGAAFADEVLPPGTPPPADIRDHPGWYVAKTFTPEVLKRFVNVLAGRNEFGTDLNRPIMDEHVPRYMQGRLGTPQMWSSMASGVHSLFGADKTPEEIREITSALIPPIQAIVSDMEKSQTEGGTGIPEFVGQLAGKSRLVGKIKSPINNAYYPAFNDALAVERDMVARHGKIPTAQESGIRSLQAREERWLAGVDATEREKQQVRALRQADREKRIKRGGPAGERVYSNEEVQRRFLNAVRER